MRRLSTAVVTAVVLAASATGVESARAQLADDQVDQLEFDKGVFGACCIPGTLFHPKPATDGYERSDGVFSEKAAELCLSPFKRNYYPDNGKRSRAAGESGLFGTRGYKGCLGSGHAVEDGVAFRVGIGGGANFATINQIDFILPTPIIRDEGNRYGPLVMYTHVWRRIYITEEWPDTEGTYGYRNWTEHSVVAHWEQISGGFYVAYQIADTAPIGLEAAIFANKVVFVRKKKSGQSETRDMDVRMTRAYDPTLGGFVGLFLVDAFESGSALVYSAGFNYVGGPEHKAKLIDPRTEEVLFTETKHGLFDVYLRVVMEY